MSWIILVGIVIAVVVTIAFLSKSSGGNTKQTSSSNNLSEISQSFVKNSVQFFSGFLSLCDKHQVVGNAALLHQGIATQEIKAKLECQFYSIDGEHADEFFNALKYAWERAKSEKNEPLERIHTGETFMKSFYDCDDLHYAYIEIDEYEFGHPEVSLSWDISLFTMNGAKWEENLSAIKQELNIKWPAAKIEVGKGGLIVKVN